MNKKLIRTGALALAMISLSFITIAPTVNAAKPSGNTGTTTTSIKPIFSSSFVQYWYAQDWTLERWNEELAMLKDIGITEIILQDVADTKVGTNGNKYAAYKTGLAGYESNDIDMIDNALTAADPLGMKVRIGLGFNGDWWKKNASDMAWLNARAAEDKAIFNEIFKNYGTHPSLSGWYIAYEFSQLTATSSTTKANLNNFLKQIGTEIRSKDSTRSIMISPFYNSKNSLFYPLSGWSTTLQTVLKDTKINIVALQDSVGANYNTLSQVPNVFSYTKKATDALSMTLYADTETFTSTTSGNVPAAQSRISSQLSAEKAYVKGFVAFSIDHFQNKNVDAQVTGYTDYYNYYLKNK